MRLRLYFGVLVLLAASVVPAADLELTETLSLPECHSLGWVRANTQARGEKAWNSVLDKAKRGTPSPEQAVARNWRWSLTDEQRQAAVTSRSSSMATRTTPASPRSTPRAVRPASGPGSRCDPARPFRSTSPERHRCRNPSSSGRMTNF